MDSDNTQQINMQYAVISQLAEKHGIQTYYSMNDLNTAIGEELAKLTQMKFEMADSFEMKQLVFSIPANDFLTFLEKNPTWNEQNYIAETLNCSMLSKYSYAKEFNIDLEKAFANGSYNFHFYLLWLDEKNVMEGIMLMTQ